MDRSLAAWIILAVLGLALPVRAAGPVLALGAPVVECPVGQTVPVSVEVAGVQELYGVEIHLRFDPAVVQVADADPGTPGIQVAPGGFLSADFVAQNQADNQAGTIDYAATQVNPNEPRSGAGTLVTILFEGAAAGRTSLLEATHEVLTTRDGEAILVTVSPAEIRVNAAPDGTTATPTPTGQPTPGGTEATPAYAGTPVAGGSESHPSPQPSPATARETAMPGPTQAGQYTVATPTPLVQTPEARAAAPSPTAGDASGGSVAIAPGASPSAPVAGSRLQVGGDPVPTATGALPRNPTPATGGPAPALLARAAPGGARASEAPRVPERLTTRPTEQAQPGRWPASWLLVAGAGSLGLALVFSAPLVGRAFQHRARARRAANQQRD